MKANKILMADVKNYIINGAMDYSQRLGFGVSLPNAVNGNYPSDRFVYYKSGTAVHTIAHSADVPTYNQSGFLGKYSILIDCTTAQASMASGDYYGIGYNVEGYDFANLRNRKCILSFWVKATKTGIFSVAIRNAAFDRCFVAEYTIAQSDVWEKKIIKIDFSLVDGTWDNTNQLGARIVWTIASGSGGQTSTLSSWQSLNKTSSINQVNSCDDINNNFRLTQVMLFPVDAYYQKIDIPFKRMGDDIQKELSLCERYFEYVGAGYFGMADSTTVNWFTMIFKTKKRVAPSGLAPAFTSSTLRMLTVDRTTTGNAVFANVSTSDSMAVGQIGNFTGLTAGNVGVERYGNNCTSVDVELS